MRSQAVVSLEKGFRRRWVPCKGGRKLGRQKCYVSSYYWSATTNPNNTSNALNVNFNNGNVNNNNKTNSYYVRAVRGG